MPKIVDKKQMQKKILNAAMKTFIKEGFHNSTMAKIAKEAGIAKGTLYLYFDSKEALSIAFVDSYFAKMETWLNQQGEAKTLDEFIFHIKTSLLLDAEEAKFIPVFFEAFGPSFGSEAFRKTIADYFDNMGNFYSQNIAQLIVNKEIHSDINPQALGRVLVSMIDGIMLHYGLFSQTRENYENMLNESLYLFKQGLLKRD